MCEVLLLSYELVLVINIFSDTFQQSYSDKQNYILHNERKTVIIKANYNYDKKNNNNKKIKIWQNPLSQLLTFFFFFFFYNFDNFIRRRLSDHNKITLPRRCASRPHKGSWVKLLLCLISIVTRSSSHLVREMNQTQGSSSEKHYGRERFGEFSRSHSGLRCLLLASQDNFNKFIAIRRRSCDLADFERRLLSCFSSDFLYCLVHMYIFISW